MGRCTPRVWVGRSKLIWVVNLRIIYGYVMSKWKKIYQGGNRAHFRGFLGLGAVVLSELKIFSWDLGYPSVYLLQTYFGQYQLDLDGAQGYIVGLCVSGLILHGAFQTKFLGILYHKLSTFMVIRRSAGCFKCDFRIFGILGNYFIMFGHHVMVLWWGHSPWFLCYQLDFLLNIFMKDRSYQ